jgi:hypothetical protein
LIASSDRSRSPSAHGFGDQRVFGDHPVEHHLARFLRLSNDLPGSELFQNQAGFHDGAYLLRGDRDDQVKAPDKAAVIRRP